MWAVGTRPTTSTNGPAKLEKDWRSVSSTWSITLPRRSMPTRASQNKMYNGALAFGPTSIVKVTITTFTPTPTQHGRGVYYVDAGDPPEGDKPSGSFTFLTPNLAEANTFFTKVVPQSTSIRPTSGLMLLFPSYLQHFVHPYDGDRPRVSISFNATKQPWP